MGDVMPVRNSTNPVEGINRCECGQVRTIHRARGKRSKYLYSICDDCGTNQQTGAFWQNRFKAHFPTIEALHASEQEIEKAAVSVVSDPISQPNPTPEQTEPQSVSNTDQTEEKPNTQEPEKPTSDRVTTEKPCGWRVVLTGIILGGLTGGLITRL